MDAKRPPALSNEAVSVLLFRHFPFTHVSMESFKPLPSYDDRNWFFEGALEEKAYRSCLHGTQYPFVLKILNSGLTLGEAKGMNEMMLLLSERGIPVTRPIATRSGHHTVALTLSEMEPPRTNKSSSAEKGEEDQTYAVRVLTYLPGIPMDKLDKKHFTPDLAYSLGKMAGKMDSILQECKHPAILAREFRDWDLMHFMDIKQYIPHVREEEKRKMADAVVAMFEEHVLPLLPEMKRGVVHHDLNGLNILFDVSGGECVLSGLIDFGDSVATCYLFELAIMMAYGMIEKESPVEFVGPMFRGYQDVFPLSKKELNCLYYAVLARFCRSAVNGEYRYTLEPWNTYLLTTPAEAWKLMKLLLALGKEKVEHIWGVWDSSLPER